MKIFLTQDEIKNHYREMHKLDKSVEIEIENFRWIATSPTETGGEQESMFDSELSELNTKIRDLASNGKKILAIKLVRTLTMWGLRESKDFVVQGRNLSLQDIRVTPLQDIRVTLEYALLTCKSVNLNG
jgi:ribosomal protein L7/L12